MEYWEIRGLGTRELGAEGLGDYRTGGLGEWRTGILDSCILVTQSPVL